MVEVRLGSLSSSGCCSGPARTTAITSLELRPGRDQSDPELAVEVAEEEEEEEAGGTADIYKI